MVGCGGWFADLLDLPGSYVVSAEATKRTSFPTRDVSRWPPDGQIKCPSLVGKGTGQYEDELLVAALQWRTEDRSNMVVAAGFGCHNWPRSRFKYLKFEFQILHWPCP